MSISSKIRTIFRGHVPLTDLPREALRRRKYAARQKHERLHIDTINSSPVRLSAAFASFSPAELLTHFRESDTSFFPFDGLDGSKSITDLHSQLFSFETEKIISSADMIVHESRWELAGLGTLEFSAENFWRRDPISGRDWGLDYHADVITTYADDAADIRILWELNRWGHAVTLACAYALTGDERFAETFFSQIENWALQNPYGRGANWNCAMEVALRAINLLAAYDIFRRSNAMTEGRLSALLKLFDHHGRFIIANNEFSYISTSNHYLSDVVGLFWIGTLLPELGQGSKWKQFGREEMLREMDKQILPDGAHFEASTGYHKLVTEMFLYSFLLAKRNDEEIPQEYWGKLHQMLKYIRGITMPDGGVPLIGDADGSQIVPLVKRDADDQEYLLALGSVMFHDPALKRSNAASPEIAWLLSEKGVDDFESIKGGAEYSGSLAFANAGSYVMRQGNLYLHFNANDCGLNGRGSHGHNDALSVEISAYGRPFIVDPGSYAYNLDREARHLFRSTIYHSTVMVDGQEQNTTSSDTPFIIGNEARPTVEEWKTSGGLDRVSATHFGYTRLSKPISHRRTVEFDKTNHYWIIEDELRGLGRHIFTFSFHLSAGLEVTDVDRRTVSMGDSDGRHLYIRAIGIEAKCEVLPAFVSRNYGHRDTSSILKWEVVADVPLIARFIIVPAASPEERAPRLELLRRLTDNIVD